MTTSLENLINEVSPENHLRVQDQLGDGFVRLRIDEAQKRQAAQDIRCVEDALLEMLRNSRDAHASTIYIAISKDADFRTITVIDDGDGIPEYLHETVFEPRVTSKLDSFHEDSWGVHGRGMALYSIKENAKTAKVCSSSLGKGSAITASFHTPLIPEKADQSTFPTFNVEANGHIKITGPKNLIRNACEFALAHRKELTVYLGSPSEIAATMYQNTLLEIPLRDRLTLEQESRAQVCNLLGFSEDKFDFEAHCRQLGLDLSSRTAHRIIEGDIAPIDDLSHIIRLIVSNSINAGKSKKRVKNLGSKVSNEDLREIEQAAKVAFEAISHKYYLKSDPDIAISCRGGNINIAIPLILDDDK